MSVEVLTKINKLLDNPEDNLISPEDNLKNLRNIGQASGIVAANVNNTVSAFLIVGWLFPSVVLFEVPSIGP